MGLDAARSRRAFLLVGGLLTRMDGRDADKRVCQVSGQRASGVRCAGRRAHGRRAAGRALCCCKSEGQRRRPTRGSAPARPCCTQPSCAPSPAAARGTGCCGCCWLQASLGERSLCATCCASARLDCVRPQPNCGGPALGARPPASRAGLPRVPCVPARPPGGLLGRDGSSQQAAAAHWRGQLRAACPLTRGPRACAAPYGYGGCKGSAWRRASPGKAPGRPRKPPGTRRAPTQPAPRGVQQRAGRRQRGTRASHTARHHAKQQIEGPARRAPRQRPESAPRGPPKAAIAWSSTATCL